MACVLYTSGSTGEPKGVMGTLARLTHFIGWEARTFGVGPGWRVSQFTPPTFDPFFRDVLLPLCTGGTICIPPQPPADLGPQALMDWIDGRAINLIHCVPSVFAMMLEAGLEPGRCRSLRWVLLAGEALQAAFARRWMAAFGDRIRLVNLYGSTETTMVALFHIVQERDLERGFIPIGKPMEGAEVLLLDGNGRPCPAGTAGDICVRSPFLTLGYYKDTAATKKAFLDGDGEGRTYRTGDLGTLLEDGSYRFLGRLDQQIKIRGVRVEPGEVAAVLLQHPQVRACVVVPRRSADKDVALAAYVVPRPAPA